MVFCLSGLVDLGLQPGVGADGGQGVETVRVTDAAGDDGAGDRSDAGCGGDDPGGIGLGVEVGAALVEVLDLFGQHLGLFGFHGDVRGQLGEVDSGLVVRSR